MAEGQGRDANGDGLNFGQPFADGVLGETGHGLDIQFLHEMFAVGVDGLEAQAQLGRDLFDGLFLGQELEDFAFAVRQQGECGYGIGRGVSHIGLDQISGD